jgi:hypothetical protein
MVDLRECNPHLRDISFDEDWTEDFVEAAAKAADLSPEDIVSIAAEFCPIRNEEFALTYAGIELATWHTPASVHLRFLRRHEARHGARHEPWYVKLLDESRAFFTDTAGDVQSDDGPAPSGPTPEPEVARASVLKESAPEFDLESEPGLLGDIARFSQSYAFRPVREFGQPTAVAVGSVMFGRRWATPTGLGLNLYQIAIGETGGGKDALLAAPKVLLSKAGLRHLIGPGDFTSDAAIETSLRSRPVQLMPLDEFGKLAQAMMGRNAPSFAKLGAKALLEIYPRSAPGSEWSGKQKADPTRDNAAEPVHAPTLSILAVSTPEGFFEGMSQQTLEDGFLNRLTLIRAGAAGPRQRDPARLDPPAELITAIQEAYSASAGGDLAEAKSRCANSQPNFRFARWADEDAERALEEVEAWEDAAGDEGRRGVTGRAAEQTQKIATIRALFRNPADPAVTAEDIQWAFAAVKSSIGLIEEGARAMMAGSEFEALCNAIMVAVEKAGPTGLPMSYLVRAKGVAKHDPRMVDSALKRLSQAERIFLNVGRGNRVRVRRDDEKIEDY